MAERQATTRPSLAAVLCLTLFFLFVCSLIFVIPYQRWSMNPAYFFEAIGNRFEQLYLFITGQSGDFAVTVYQYIAVMLAGSALACCGAVFQGGFRNVLAGPSTMGVMSGGTLGLMIYLLFYSPSATSTTLQAWAQRGFFEIFAQQLITLAGCIAGVGLVLAVATAAGRGRLSATAMILSGTVFSTLTGNAAQLLQYYLILTDPTDPRIDAIRNLVMGSFVNITSWRHILMMAIPILLCLAIMLRLRYRMELFSLNDDEALASGVNVRRLRYAIVAAGSVLTAVVIAFCGHIGFLGFMIPLIGRRICGPQMAKLLPASILLGAIVLVVVYDAAYIAGLQDYINVFTSAIGGFTLLLALLRKGGARRAA
ncbi:MAG: iron ABC transporter permease [Bacillota bacterium]|nr:iron ABC transporter permease [Bacillota bacterium]